MSKDQLKSTPLTPCLNPDFLTKVIWDALTPDEVDKFNRNVICRTYKAGQTIFSQDDPCKGLYLIEDGLVAIRMTDDEGQSAIVRLVHRGDSLGYRPLLARENHRATAEVIKNARICSIDAKTVRGFLNNNPELSTRFLAHIAHALGEAEERLFQVAAQSLRTRIIHLLFLLSDHYGETTSDGTLFVELPMTRRGLAEMVGARPESVSRTLLEMQDDGLLKLSGRTVRVDQFDRLVDELHHTFLHVSQHNSSR